MLVASGVTNPHVSREVTDHASNGRRHMQMQAVVDEALIAYERGLFWESFEAGYARLADHSGEWDEIVAERRGEEQALADGLE